MISATRRRFFAFAGSAPLAAKAAADQVIASAAGLPNIGGFGSAGLGLASGGSPPVQVPSDANAPFIPYDKRIMAAGDYLKVFGLPDWLEFELREQSKWVGALDPDLACKRSWSMSVKISEQRQRNYQRAVERMQRSAWTFKGRRAIQKMLGFEWPW